MGPRTVTIVVAAFALALARPSSAHAQDSTPSSGQSAAFAEQLFRDGRELLAAKRYDQACAKLEQSLAIERAMGTLGNLAYCNEQRGRLASAWAQYREVADHWTEQPESAALARKRAAELEPRLSKLRVVVPEPARAAGLEVRLDGVVVPIAHPDLTVPVDGGEHRIEASAPGREPATQTISLPKERGTGEVQVPVLARRETSEPTPPPGSPLTSRGPLAPAPPPRDAPIAAYVVGGTGVAALAVGAVFGVVVATGVDDVDDTSKPIAERNRRYDTLSSQATIANVLVPVGALLTGLGIYLLVRHPFAAPTGARDHR